MPKVVAPVVAAGALGATDQPELVCDELTLRPWRQTDVAALICAYSQPDIHRWHAQSLDEPEARAWVASRSQRWRHERGADWAVADRGGVLGRVGFTRLQLPEGSGEVVYWVLPQARGRRVAARALGAISEWAFAQIGFHRLELTHATANLASCRVARTAGYELEGTMRAQALHADGWHDMHLHARLAGDPHPGTVPA